MEKYEVYCRHFSVIIEAINIVESMYAFMKLYPTEKIVCVQDVQFREEEWKEYIKPINEQYVIKK